MKAIIDALNVVYKEKRGFIKLNLISLAFTFAAIGALLFALGAIVVLPIALSYLGLLNASDLVFRFARWPLLLALVMVGLAVLYRPRRETSGGARGAWPTQSERRSRVAASEHRTYTRMVSLLYVSPRLP